MIKFNNRIDDSLYRIDTIGDGSCFIHCVMMSLFPKYEQLNTHDKHRAARQLRRHIAKSLTCEQWTQLGKGEIAKDAFYTTMRNVGGVDDVVLQKLSVWYADKNLLHIPEWISPTLVKSSIVQAYNTFIGRLKDTRNWIDITMIEAISNVMNVDIYILQDTTGLPYKLGGGFSHLNDRESILILWVDEQHYESLCQIDIDKKSAQFIFYPDCDLIQKIKREL